MTKPLSFKLLIARFSFLVFLASLLISCASSQRYNSEICACAAHQPEIQNAAAPAQGEWIAAQGEWIAAQGEWIAAHEPPLSAEKPELPVNIMGRGKVRAEHLALFLLQNNPIADSDFVKNLADYYVEEAGYEGINHDIAFAQMCLETGFLRFGGDVKPQQHNFAGLGAVGGGEPGLSFPSPRIGVRAQVQHLKAYGSQEPLKGELVNPRFRFVRRGSSPTIEGLAGTWAADRQYAAKINSIIQRLYDFSF